MYVCISIHVLQLYVYTNKHVHTCTSTVHVVLVTSILEGMIIEMCA